MSEIINIDGKDVTAIYEDALQTHQRIMANGEICARSLYEVCKDLKKMRDEKLYEQLGYDTFDKYCENMAGIKARMAYYYISAYESLGATVLQSNANLGITKLELIARMNPVERAEGLYDGTFENMSVSEIKELIKKNKEMGEQIDLLQGQIDEMQTTDNIQEDCNESAEENTELDDLRDEIELLNKKLLEKDKQHEQELKDLREDVEYELREQIEEEYKSKLTDETTETVDNSAELQKQIDEAVAAAKKETEKEAKAKYAEKSKKQSERIKELEDAIASADSINKNLEKQLSLADTKSAQAMVYIQAIQDNFNSLFSLVEEMDAEQQEKFKGAVLKLTTVMQEKAGA